VKIGGPSGFHQAASKGVSVVTSLFPGQCDHYSGQVWVSLVKAGHRLFLHKSSGNPNMPLAARRLSSE
jgi:hypothetical protein